MKLTPIFPADIKPVHEGVYKVFQADVARPGYALWQGCWGVTYRTLREAKTKEPDSFFADQQKAWQGVL